MKESSTEDNSYPDEALLHRSTDQESNESEGEKNLLQILSKMERNIGYQGKFKREKIRIKENQFLSAVFIQSHHKSGRTFYLGHGFGGTSLMYFPLLPAILQRGNVVLWEIRGMGLCEKCEYPESDWMGKENQFYSEGLEKILKHFNHEKIVFICHSFSSYICFRYLIEKPFMHEVEKVILLSPIGITAKELDYKNKTTSCKDIWHTFYSRVGWKFNLTYKSALRTVCRCFKSSLLRKSFQSYPLLPNQLDLIVKIFQEMVGLPDGSQHLFFNYFMPRVLPRPQNSIQELLEIEGRQYRYKTSIYFGGEEDWADRTGAQILSQKFNNLTQYSVQNLGHLMLLYPEAMREIIEKEIG